MDSPEAVRPSAGKRSVWRKRVLVHGFFLILALVLYWLNNPLGVYDIGQDHWLSANFIAGHEEGQRFTKDPFLSDTRLYSFTPEIRLHERLSRFFPSFESYIQLLNSALFFLSAALLFELFLVISMDFIVAFWFSALFSFSTFYFSTGDLFAFILVIAANGKIISFNLYLLALILIIRRPDSPSLLLTASFLLSLLIWIHPLTFLGPGIATLAALPLLYGFRPESPLKRKHVLTMVLIVAGTTFFYFVIFLNFFAGMSNAAGLDRNVFRNVYLRDFNAIYPPYYRLSNFTSEAIPFIMERLKKLPFHFLLPLLTLGCLLPWLKLNRTLRLLLLLILLVPLGWLGMISVDYWLHSDGMLASQPVIRNLKWVVFYGIAFVVGLFPFVQDLFQGHETVKNRRKAYAVFMIAGVCLFAVPIGKTYGYVRLKLLDKTGRLVQKDEKQFLSLNDLNRDADELTSFISLSTSADAAFIGPLWLRYRTRRSLVYDGNDGPYFLRRLDPKYLEWKRLGKIVNTIEQADPSRWKDELKPTGADYFVFEKFISVPWRRVFKRKDQSIEKASVIFENASFAVIPLRS